MKGFSPEKYESGVWLSSAISGAAIELDEAIQFRNNNFQNINSIKEFFQKHSQESKSANALRYSEDYALINALSFDVIPKTFNMPPENCKNYNLADYLAGLELVLEPMNNLEHASLEQLRFLRDFIVDLGDKRLSRLESLNKGYLAA